MQSETLGRVAAVAEFRAAMRLNNLKRADQRDSQLRLALALEGLEYKQKDATAADQGDAAAQCNLATCYLKGQGVEHDRYQAIRWYQQAAMRGD
eukprot:SAG22_NODE_15148_length_356_cov_0.521401_1_plen_93_part_01